MRQSKGQKGMDNPGSTATTLPLPFADVAAEGKAVNITLTVNHQRHMIAIEPRVTFSMRCGK